MSSGAMLWVRAKAEDGGSLGAAGGEDVEDGEVAVGVLGAGQLDFDLWALRRCGLRGLRGGLRGGGLRHSAHAGDGAAEHGLQGWVAA